MTERKRITLERVYDASIEDVWELWTTKAGIESWWGPDGFAVTVDALELRPGGALHYRMTAVRAEEIAFMKREGIPVEHVVRGHFIEVVPRRRLAFVQHADFIPGVAPYDIETRVDLHESGGRVRMVLTFDAMHDELWTQRATQGYELELGRLERILQEKRR
jgi:uncharacterized protein YndB with AHSA1/START domain